MSNEITPFEKQYTEKRTITCDLSAELPSGVTVSSGVVSALDEDDNDVSGTILTSTTAAVTTTSGTFIVEKDVGTVGHDYRIHLLLTLSNGNTWDERYLMKIRSY